MHTLRHARRSDDHGFTFVEVLVVIIILSVLSLIAIATFFGQREKAERARALSSLRNAETFAVAIRSDGTGYSECDDDYNREAGENAPYTWLEDTTDASASLGGGSDASYDANTISVYGPEANGAACEYPNEGDGWVSFAAIANEQCYYNLLVPGSDVRIRHKAQALLDGSGTAACEGSEIQPGATDGKIDFRSDANIDPSGW